jgi:hypothetical protein
VARHGQQRDLNLGGVFRQAQKLGFGHFFRGHEVQDGNFERTDVLIIARRSSITKMCSLRQDFCGGQGRREFYGHREPPLSGTI